MELNVKKLPMLQKPRRGELEMEGIREDSRREDNRGFGWRRRRSRVEKVDICGWEMDATEYIS